jgi:putative transposase
MPEYRRLRQPGGTYFFTVTLDDRHSDLLIRRINDLRVVMQHVKAVHPFQIDAWVVLPEHLHMLWTLPPGDVDYSTRWSRIKAGLSKRVPRSEAVSGSRSRKGERQIWQRRFYEHTIRDQDDFNAHVDYIHFNPVKHGHAARPVEWPFSSIHEFIRRGVLDSDWGTGVQIADLECE